MMHPNVFTIVGHIGKVEQRQTRTGSESTLVTVFVSDDYKDKNNSWVDRAYPFFVSLYGGTAEYAASAVGVGDLVFVSGKLSTTPRDSDSYKIFLTGRELTLLRKAEKKDPSSGGTQDRSRTRRSKPTPASYEEDDVDLDELLDVEFDMS